MEKYKFDENNGLWYELQGDLKTTGGRTGAYRDMGAAAFTVSERKQTGAALRFTAQWQA
jgi:hypothetical protein